MFKKLFKKKIVVIFIIFLIIIAVAFSVINFMESSNNNYAKKPNDVKEKDSKSAKNTATIAPKPILVTTKVVSETDLKIMDTAIGSIYNLNTLDVTSEVNAKILGIYADIGSTVKKGSILVSLDKAELKNNKKAKQASLEQVKVQYANQKKTLGRYAELLKDGYISKADYENAQSKLNELEEQMNGLSAELKNLDISIGKTDIASPINGIVQDRYVSNGSVVNSGSKLLTIVDNSKLYILVDFPERYLEELRAGQDVTITTYSSSATIHSTIKEIKPVINEESRAAQLIIEIDNASNNYNLRPGGSVNVSVLVKTKKDAVILPEESVVLRPKGTVAYVLRDDNKVKEVAIKVGYKSNGQIEILEGISSGDQVVVQGAGFLNDGASVSIKK